MKCVLKITEGPATDQTISIEHGDTVTVGRSERAAFVIAGDDLLSGLHFSVKCDVDGCFVQDLGSTNKTTVNGEVVSRRPIVTGDVIQGGNSAFEVTVDTDPGASASGHVATLGSKRTAVGMPKLETEDFGPTTGFVAPSAAAILGRFGLKDEPFESVDEKMTPEDLVGRLQKGKQPTEAIRFLALALPKRLAVWWACQCVRHAAGDAIDAIDAGDTSALEAAETWAAEPTEENRRAAMTVADKLGHKTAASWGAVGAFWSGGSMAPPTAPVVPPADDLTGKAIFGAVRLAAVARQPEQAPQKHDRFIELALAVSRGENTWKEASASA